MAATEELGLEVFVEGWQKFERILDRLDKDVDKTGQSMTKTGSIAGGAFAVALGTIAVNAAMALGRALWEAGKAVIDFGAESLRMAADFQSQMSILSIAASSTGLSFDQLHDAALQVGGDTTLLGVSATGAADAMTGLFKAGMSNVEVFGDLEGYMEGTAELGGALRASIDLAAASELDMVQASDLAAIALATFGSGLETETERANFINEAMNNMVQAADASVAEVSGLAEALRMVGPSASAAGLSIQDTNNALAILSTAGIQGSRAGSNLGAMLRSLRDPTKQAAEEFEKLGVEIFDVGTGEMLPMVDIIGQFETALDGATEAEQAAALGAIFTAQGGRVMDTMLIRGVKGWNDMAEATENAAGIQEVAEARSKTFNAQMEAMEGTVETLKIGIGEQFLPVATELVSWFSEMVDKHGPELQAIFEAVAVVVSDVANFLMGLLDTGDPLNDFFTQLPEPIKVFVKFMQDDFLPAVREVWNFVMEQVAVVVAWFQENLPLIQNEGQKMADFWQYVIAPTLDNVWEIIKTIVGVGIETILNILTLGMQIANRDWEGAWQTVQEITNTVWEAIKSIVTEFIEGVANAMGTTTAEIVETWKSNWEMAKVIVSQTWTNIQDAVTNTLVTIVNTVREKIQSIVATLRGFVSAFREAGSNLINALKAGILSAARSVVEAARSVVEDAVAAAKGALGIDSPSRVFFAIGEGLADGFIGGIQSKAKDVADAVSQMFGVGGVFGSLGSAAAARLKETKLDPLTAQLKGWREELESISGQREMLMVTGEELETLKKKLVSLRKVREEAEGKEISAWGRIIDHERFNKMIKEEVALEAEIADKLANANIEQAKFNKMVEQEAGLKAEVARAEAEQVKLNKQLLALEKQRKNLAFLKQQMGLLDLIKEHGLDAKDILGGIELGIDASLEGIVQAMTRAMAAVVEQVEQELEISSPSAVFARIGQQMMEGITRGIAQLTPKIQAQMQAVVQAPAALGGGNTYSSEVTNQYNLTTQSTTHSGGLAMEFSAMSFAGAGVSR